MTHGRHVRCIPGYAVEPSDHSARAQTAQERVVLRRVVCRATRVGVNDTLSKVVAERLFINPVDAFVKIVKVVRIIVAHPPDQTGGSCHRWCELCHAHAWVACSDVDKRRGKFVEQYRCSRDELRGWSLHEF